MHNPGMHTITISIDDLVDGELESELVVYDNFGPISTT